ncbi:MAG: DUF5317 family protein [Eubacteriaceae bacterium]|jgi:hypothetical protein|nr:DUF5317 family protein [Eubacteriaceae bacterium]
MVLTTFFLAGVVWGFARKGSLANALETDFRTWYLFAISIALFLVLRLGVSFGFEFVSANAYIFLLAAYCMLLLGIMFNIRGLNYWMIFLLAGALLNFAVIFLNNGEMPYIESALRIAGISADAVDNSPIQKVANDTTMLKALCGIVPIPLPIVPEVVSIGTLIMSLGLFGTVKNLLLGISYIEEEEEEEPQDASEFRPEPAYAAQAAKEEAVESIKATKSEKRSGGWTRKKRDSQDGDSAGPLFKDGSEAQAADGNAAAASYATGSLADRGGEQASGKVPPSTANYSYAQDEFDEADADFPLADDFPLESGSLHETEGLSSGGTETSPILFGELPDEELAGEEEPEEPVQVEILTRTGAFEAQMYEPEPEFYDAEAFEPGFQEGGISPFVDITQQSFDDEDEFSFSEQEPDELEALAQAVAFAGDAENFDSTTIPWRDSLAEDGLFITKVFKALRDLEDGEDGKGPVRQIPISDVESGLEEPSERLAQESATARAQEQQISPFASEASELPEPDSQAATMGLQDPLLEAPEENTEAPDSRSINELISELYNRVVASPDADKEEAAVDAIKRLLADSGLAQAPQSEGPAHFLDEPSDDSAKRPSQKAPDPLFQTKEPPVTSGLPATRESELEPYRGEDEMLASYFEDSGLLDDSDFFDEPFYGAKNGLRSASSRRMLPEEESGEYYAQPAAFGHGLLSPESPVALPESPIPGIREAEDSYDPSSPFIIVNGRIVENPNYKFKKASRSEAAQEGTPSLASPVSNASRNPSLRKSKPNFSQPAEQKAQPAPRGSERISRISNVNIDFFKKGQ